MESVNNYVDSEESQSIESSEEKSRSITWYGASSLNHHISKCKEIKFKDTGEMMIDKQGRSKSNIDQMVSRDMCVAAIIEHDLPFEFVEYEKVRSLIKYLNPDVVPISRNTVEANVLNIYKKEKEKLKQEMTSIPSRISLTFDLWTACTTEGYICLTAHFVDTNWKLNSKILNFCHMPPPHIGFEFSEKILDFLKDWEIEKKIFSLTLDHSALNDIMQETLKNQLVSQNWLLCDGEFFNVHCFAHILNLIVQEGLKVASDVLHKIRESIKYIRSSESRMKKFKECIEQIGGVATSIGLHLDVNTRWNSTYLMLESALKYQHVFTSLHLNDETYKYCPSMEEWRRGGKICQLWLPFYETVNLISGTSYPTSNLYFLIVWKIQCALIDSSRDEDEVIKSMANRMMVKFEKYWDEYSLMLALGAVLDPRMKFSMLAYCYSKVDASNCERKLEQVKRNLYMLFEMYSSKSTSSDVRGSIQTESSTKAKKFKPFPHNLFDELKMHNQQFAAKVGKSQLDVYLDEPNLDFNYYEDLDILQWWKDNNNRFSDLSIMACDLLSIPITTIASESSFSIGSCVLNKYRSRLLSNNVEALICTRNWLHGFVCDGGDDGEDEYEKSGAIFSEESI